VAPQSTVEYYNNVVRTIGQKQADDSVPLFFAPGMAHCGGGEGPNVFDALTSLEQWREQGKRPRRSSRRTRPTARSIAAVRCARSRRSRNTRDRKHRRCGELSLRVAVSNYGRQPNEFEILLVTAPCSSVARGAQPQERSESPT
jgi:hypothetical protein